MLHVTRWAGRHPLLVRAVILPVLFYIQGRVAFIAGADLFFDGLSMPNYWFWGLMGTIWLVAYVYPADARTQLNTAYWRIKGLEWVACSAAFGLWLYAGNQMARQYETPPTRSSTTISATVAGLSGSENRTLSEEKGENKLKRAYRNYFRNAVGNIKQRHGTKKMSTGLSIVLGILGIGLGIIVLVCGIQCGSTGGAVALGVIGGLGLIGLGVWALIAGLRKKTPAG